MHSFQSSPQRYRVMLISLFILFLSNTHQARAMNSCVTFHGSDSADGSRPSATAKWQQQRRSRRGSDSSSASLVHIKKEDSKMPPSEIALLLDDSNQSYFREKPNKKAGKLFGTTSGRRGRRSRGKVLDT